MVLTIIIIALVALAALLGIVLFFVLRNKKHTNEFTVDDLFWVTTSPLTKWLTKKKVSELVQDLSNKWVVAAAKDFPNKIPELPNIVWQALTNYHVVFYDQKFILVNRDGMRKKVSGVTFPSYRLIYIATIPSSSMTDLKERILKLLRHELSHPIVSDLYNIYDEDAQHEIFKRVGV